MNKLDFYKDNESNLLEMGSQLEGIAAALIELSGRQRDTPPLPWIEKISTEYGVSYYWNPISGETTWERPEMPPEPPPSPSEEEAPPVASADEAASAFAELVDETVESKSPGEGDDSSDFAELVSEPDDAGHETLYGVSGERRGVGAVAVAAEDASPFGRTAMFANLLAGDGGSGNPSSTATFLDQTYRVSERATAGSSTSARKNYWQEKSLFTAPVLVKKPGVKNLRPRRQCSGNVLSIRFLLGGFSDHLYYTSPVLGEGGRTGRGGQDEDVLRGDPDLLAEQTCSSNQRGYL